ncbi:hypothetical protein MSAN_00190200 [Mycena sanguinolenta]|uniref:Uncharacterized protein n=1 Tax=Mycena sanguinolenta TaxID=230812 RepID=A0A8H6ZER7_9AGAR|nr:hypothetical protein MSAN_00190200 [Mycena sanguinolenta]
MPGRRYGPAHLQGAIAFAARQAALRRKLATRFRRLWWHLSDRVQGPGVPESSASSGADEQDAWVGDDCSDGDEDSGAPREPAELTGEEDAEQEQLKGAENLADLEGSSTGDSESEEGIEDDAAVRMAEIDELLALQVATSSQYDEI